MSNSETNLNNALDALQSRIGQSNTASDWFEVTQDRIDGFAEVTMDHQWIHVDVEKAKSGPFGEPIAHGHLTLSIMGHLPKQRACPDQNSKARNSQSITVLTKSDSLHPCQSALKLERPALSSELRSKVE